MSLKQQFKSGLFWTFIDAIFLKGFTFLVMLGLARLLTPKDFGLIGVISIFIVIGTALIDGGMGNSIIRDNKADISDFSSVFFGNMLISFAIYPVLYFTAPLIANFFNEVILINIIRLYGLSFLLSPFFSIQHSVLVKEMEFKKITILNLPSVIIGSLVGLTLAYLGHGVWSLVWMRLSMLIIKAILYWTNSKWIPELKISTEKLKKHFKFGYKLMISSLLDSLTKEVYSFLIGKSFSIKTLGYFNQAKSLRNYPVTLISTIMSKVTYPLLSKIQEDKGKVALTYGRILRSIFFVICPIMLCLLIIAEPLIVSFLTDRWLTSVPYFQILTISGMLIPIHSFNINVFKIYNRTDLFLKLEIIKVAMVFVTIFFAITFGIYGLLISIVVSSYLSFFVNTYYSGELINYSTLHQLKDMAPVFLIGLFTSIISYFLIFALKNFHNYVQIIVTISFFLLIYTIISYFFNKKTFIEVKELVFNLIAVKQ